jgi:hypothetical protein
MAIGTDVSATVFWCGRGDPEIRVEVEVLWLCFGRSGLALPFNRRDLISQKMGNAAAGIPIIIAVIMLRSMVRSRVDVVALPGDLRNRHTGY